ncbi:MAG: RNA-binding protein [Desulfobulbus sp.]|nr:MAG: RNA-binding protein [Desulfobulbus sp.]RUM34326.1 MAG: RNA-binding protein [Desulfobulbus sp.]
MCQISVVVERGGVQEPVMESVTGLEMTTQGVVLSTFFEEPVTVPDVHIKEINFLGGSVILVPNQAEDTREHAR